jgi:hypothetical protein
MAGIERVHILQGFPKGDGRDKKSLAMEPTANGTYFEMFAKLGLPLQDGVHVEECDTVKDLEARYDYIDGIDCFLNFKNGHRASIQEKFLFTKYKTVTFTDTNKMGYPGSFYTCISQYYFVGYAKDYPADKSFRDYILVDFPGLLRWDAMNNLKWGNNANTANGLKRINFRYLHYDNIPSHLVIYRSDKDKPQGELLF